jgi:ligand-binding sensor domain-containing protein/signal transduction histidine kinase
VASPLVRHKFPTKCLFIALVLEFSHPLAAKGPERSVKLPILEGSDIAFSGVSSAASIAHTSVVKIVQDDLGFLWFGTLQGLWRYDGYEFRPFRPEPDNPGSLSGSFIVSAFKDHAGSLWIGSDDFLDRYDAKKEAFIHYAKQGPNSVYRMSQDRERILWLCTDQGLNRLDPVSGRVTKFTHTPGSPGTLMSNFVRSALEDSRGTFWVASASGIDEFDRKRGEAVRHFPFDFHPGSGPIALFEDSAGAFWVAFSAGNGLATFDRNTGTYTQYETGERNSFTHQMSGLSSIYEDADGVLWLGAFGGGLLRLNRERTRFTRYRHHAADTSSLIDDTIHALFEDRDGIMWVGTNAGINRFTRKRVPFRIYHGITSDGGQRVAEDVWSIFEDSHDNLWVGARNALSKIIRTKSSYSPQAAPISGRLSLQNQTFISIAEDHSGDLWFGSLGGGLYRLNPRTRQIDNFRHDPSRNDSLSHDYPSSLYVDREGTLWVGTDEALDRFDPKRGSFEHFRPDVSGLVRYHAIKEDRYGNLWLASWGAGLHRFDPRTGKFNVHMHKPGDPNSLSSDRTNSVCIDREGILWIGTSNGLNRFDPLTGNFQAFYERDGLADNAVHSILEDRRGNLWIATANGLSRYDRLRKSFRNYSAADGLPGNQFSVFPAAWQNAAEEMFFGLTSGTISFFPDQIVDDNTPPPVLLTDFRVFGTPVPIGRDSVLPQSISTAASITLPPSQNTFSFEFAALNSRSPDRSRYRFRLENLEDHWNETGSNRRFTTYTTVPSGDYVFRVQASDARGVWNEAGVSLRIQVLPPWFATWWFRTFFVVTLLLLLWAAYWYRLHQIAREFNAQLEGRVDERLRVARDLHDTLLQSFQGLMLRFQTVQNLLPGRVSDAREILRAALDEGAQAIGDARDAVQGLRSSTMVTNDLVRAVEALGEEMAEHKRSTDEIAPAFSVEVEGTQQDLHPILRDEIYRIAGEALRNAFRHARAQRIEVEFRYDPSRFRVRVRDDGIGIDPSVLDEEGRPGHWGLKGMRERAHCIGGQLEVWTEHGSGTEIELAVPGSVAYQGYSGRPLRLLRKEPTKS